MIGTYPAQAAITTSIVMRVDNIEIAKEICDIGSLFSYNIIKYNYTITSIINVLLYIQL